VPLAQDRPKCSYYKKLGYNKSKCWLKHPENKPKKANFKEKGQKRADLKDNKDVTLIMNAETALFNQNDESISNWILDSAVTRHICYNRDLFTYIEPYEIPLKWGKAS
jgi:hypothetical protein